LPIGKGEYLEPGLQENPVRNFTGRRILVRKKLNLPKGRFFSGSKQTALLALGFERRSVVRVLPIGKGEYREPGLQENSVRNFTGRRILVRKKLNLPKGRFFISLKALPFSSII